MKQPKNLLHLPKTTRNARKIANKLMTVTSAEINLQSEHDLIRQVAKVKAATSAHSMVDVIPTIKPKENIVFTQIKKTISVTLPLY